MSERSRRSFNNRTLIERSGHCACFYCLSIYPASQVKDYIIELKGGQTAKCPLCGIDAVIPDSGRALPTPATLKRWHQKSFQ